MLAAPSPQGGVLRKANTISRRMSLTGEEDEVPPTGAAENLLVLASGISFAVRLKWFLGTSKFGVALHIVDIFLSVVTCALYVDATYDKGTMAPALRYLWLGAIAFFLAQWMLTVFIAKKKMRTVLSLQSALDLMSMVPFLTLLSSDNPSLLLRTFRLFGMARITHVRVIAQWVHSDIKKQLFSIATTVLILTFWASAVVQLAESNEDWYPPDVEYKGPVSFATAFYFIIMTITTVGYGDVQPHTSAGRFTVMILMGAALLTIPKQTNKLIVMLARQSPYVARSYHATSKCEHIVVCGALGSWIPSAGVGMMVPPTSTPWKAGSGVLPFFAEFFHEDHGSMDRSAVVMDKGQPSHDMQVLLTDPRFALGMTYLDGDVMMEKDLKRASVETAKAIFVFANKFADDVDAEDSHTILRALSIKRYVLKTRGRDPLTCVQLIRPENKQLFLSSVERFQKLAQAHAHANAQMVLRAPPSLSASKVSKKKDAVHPYGSDPSGPLATGEKVSSPNVAICIEQVKLQLLAKSCVVPGLPNLLFHLTASSGEESEEATEPWLREYSDGSQYEVYRVPLSTRFTSLTFADTARIVYMEVGVVLFALEIWSADGSSERVVLNPGHFALPEISRHRIHGYVIAQDKRQADRVSTLGMVSGPARVSITRSKVAAANAAKKFDVIADIMTSTKRARARERLKTERKAAIPGSAANGGDGGGGGGSTTPMEDESSTDDEGVPVGNERSAVLKAFRRDFGDAASLFKRCVVGTVIEDVSAAPVRIKNHILVCGLGTVSTSALEHLIRPLRASFLPLAPTIVILQTELPSRKHQRRLCGLRDIWFVQGSPFTSADLVRAGVTDAVTAVIFKQNISKADDVSLVDADTICIYRLMKARNPGIEIVCELISKSSIGYLSTETSDEYSTPVFAAGHVFTPALLDILLCQAFYAPHLPTIFDRLLAEDESQADKDWAAKNGEDVGHMEPSHLYLIPVPRSAVGGSYADLFSHQLANFSTVCLGLRRVNKDVPQDAFESFAQAAAPISRIARLATRMGNGAATPSAPTRGSLLATMGESNSQYYVYTNPCGTTHIRDSDKVFVLAQHAPYGALAPFHVPREEADRGTGKARSRSVIGASKRVGPAQARRSWVPGLAAENPPPGPAKQRRRRWTQGVLSGSPTRQSVLQPPPQRPPIVVTPATEDSAAGTASGGALASARRASASTVAPARGSAVVPAVTSGLGMAGQLPSVALSTDQDDDDDDDEADGLAVVRPGRVSATPTPADDDDSDALPALPASNHDYTSITESSLVPTVVDYGAMTRTTSSVIDDGDLLPDPAQVTWEVDVEGLEEVTANNRRLSAEVTRLTAMVNSLVASKEEGPADDGTQ